MDRLIQSEIKHRDSKGVDHTRTYWLPEDVERHGKLAVGRIVVIAEEGLVPFTIQTLNTSATYDMGPWLQMNLKAKIGTILSLV